MSDFENSSDCDEWSVSVSDDEMGPCYAVSPHHAVWSRCGPGPIPFDVKIPKGWCGPDPEGRDVVADTMHPFFKERRDAAIRRATAVAEPNPTVPQRRLSALRASREPKPPGRRVSITSSVSVHDVSDTFRAWDINCIFVNKVMVSNMTPAERDMFMYDLYCGTNTERSLPMAVAAVGVPIASH